ncbi:putative membrane protein [Rhizobium phage Pasto]|uniref:Putative membrane protein n=1 Tax=Rhizobium phage Pasto TaxID=2767575 RepID=A0A7S6R6X9_9CAUD|nr:putative membrane protein [Rhizobium phage Pasto]
MPKDFLREPISILFAIAAVFLVLNAAGIWPWGPFTNH